VQLDANHLIDMTSEVPELVRLGRGDPSLFGM